MKMELHLRFQFFGFFLLLFLDVVPVGVDQDQIRLTDGGPHFQVFFEAPLGRRWHRGAVDLILGFTPLAQAS